MKYQSNIKPDDCQTPGNVQLPIMARMAAKAPPHFGIASIRNLRGGRRSHQTVWGPVTNALTPLGDGGMHFR